MACRAARASLWLAHTYRRPGLLIHSQQGHITDTRIDFMYRGGTLMTSRCVVPAVTASRCSQIRSICQFGTNVVCGSSTGHISSTNVRSERAACSVTRASCSAMSARRSRGAFMTLLLLVRDDPRGVIAPGHGDRVNRLRPRTWIEGE